MALLDSNGPLDKYSALLVLSYTASYILAIGLGGKEAFLRAYYSLFGLNDVGDKISFDKESHTAAAGAAFALPAIGLVLPALLGTETENSRHARHVFGFWICFGVVALNLKYLFFTKDDPFSGTVGNYFWTINNSFLLYLHYRWVGRDVLGKLKLA